MTITPPELYHTHTTIQEVNTALDTLTENLGQDAEWSLSGTLVVNGQTFNFERTHEDSLLEITVSG